MVAKTKHSGEKRPGHPVVWTPEKKVLAVQKICKLIATSEQGIHTICSNDPSLPSVSTFLDWKYDDKSIKDDYARAKEDQAEFMEEQILKITNEAKEPLRNPATGQPLRNKDGSLMMRKSSEETNYARLAIDTRKWLMAHLRPKKYGERTTIAGDPDAPLHPTATKPDLSGLTNEELDAYIKLQQKVEGKLK